MIALVLSLALLAAQPASAPAPQAAQPTSELGRGYAAYRAGDYHAAVQALRAAVTKDLHSKDWALFILGESEFYDGDYRAARDNFEKLVRGHEHGRPAQMAPFRIADCLWMEGDHVKAAATYAKLAKGASPRNGDVALARFRVAEQAAERNREAARPQFLAIARDFPAHPLADEALRRIGAGATPTTTAPTTTPGPADLPPADRLRRAEALSKDRHWDEALAELAKLPATLPPEQAAERDYQIGMTKFHMRRDYPGAGTLLLATADHLTGEKAASAQFHGARALSRVDRDDEAIAGYRKVIEKYGHSRYAAEAQYLSGWLEYNRGRYRESIPAFEATLKNFGSSAFADDAAWSLAFAHFLLGDAAEAAAGFDRYGRLPPTGIASDEIAARVKYWHARLHEKAGKKDEAEAIYRDLARRGPFSFYGLLSRARLKEAGHPEPIELPVKKIAVDPPPKSLKEPSVARANELIAAGMTVEAGEELEANEKEILKHLGGDKSLPWLIDLYRRAGDYHRVYRLGESRGGAALAADPLKDEGTRAMWEAAFPRAYQPLVEKYGAAAGNPELFLYAIMRKESGYDPHDVSYADARGLLQMIPPTSTQVAAAMGEPFFPDQLYEPEINIRLGASYIGQLYGKFGREIQLTAGAYNGGPRMMARWCAQYAKHPTDELVELIAFPQTREYVKRVTTIYAKYRYLYGAAPYEIPLVLTTKVDSHGPTY
ncbi:MAG TPA: transglycosylase SLT domain-containing protein [Polyangia bacterium]|nr:transglycosylase SLT domain-containing protein [Polyangia bacterium]